MGEVCLHHPALACSQSGTRDGTVKRGTESSQPRRPPASFTSVSVKVISIVLPLTTCALQGGSGAGGSGEEGQCNAEGNPSTVAPQPRPTNGHELESAAQQNRCHVRAVWHRASGIWQGGCRSITATTAFIDMHTLKVCRSRAVAVGTAASRPAQGQHRHRYESGMRGAGAGGQVANAGGRAAAAASASMWACLEAPRRTWQGEGGHAGAQEQVHHIVQLALVCKWAREARGLVRSRVRKNTQQKAQACNACQGSMACTSSRPLQPAACHAGHATSSFLAPGECKSITARQQQWALRHTHGRRGHCTGAALAGQQAGQQAAADGGRAHLCRCPGTPGPG